MTTTVVHVDQPHDIYIGRAVPRRGFKKSRWANLDAISETLTRENVINLYENWLRLQLRIGRVTREDLESLQGKVLGCWCKPEACHGDVIAWYADNIDIVFMSDDQLFQAVIDRGVTIAVDGAETEWGKERRMALKRENMARIHPPGKEESDRMESDAISRAEGRAWSQGEAAGYAAAQANRD